LRPAPQMTAIASISNLPAGHGGCGPRRA